MRHVLDTACTSPWPSARVRIGHVRRQAHREPAAAISVHRAPLRNAADCSSPSSAAQAIMPFRRGRFRLYARRATRRRREGAAPDGERSRTQGRGREVRPQGLRPRPLQGPPLPGARPRPGRRSSASPAPSRPSGRPSSTASTTTSTSTPRPSEDDLDWIADRMRQIIKGKHAFKVREITAAEGRELFKDNPYKLELIDGLTNGQDEYGNAAAGARPDASPSTPRTRSPTCAAGRTSRAPATSTRRRSRSCRSPARTGAATRRTRCSSGSTPPPGPTAADLKAHLARAGGGRPPRPPQARPRAGAVHQQPALRVRLPDAGCRRAPPSAGCSRRSSPTTSGPAGYQHVYTPDLAKHRPVRSLRPLGPLQGQHVPADGSGERGGDWCCGR